MEEETKVNFFEKALLWVKSHLAITIGIVAAVVVVIILICVLAGGGPKGAVKGFISGMNKKNAAKVIDNMDIAGAAVWSYYYDVDDFSDDDYDEFIENYEEIDKDEIKDQEDDLETTLEDGFDSIDDNYKSYKITVEEFKSQEEIAKDLFAVKAKIAVQAKPEDDDYDEVDESNIMTFVVYKGKVIYTDFL